jgi:phosphatidate cytidylyltransferase
MEISANLKKRVLTAGIGAPALLLLIIYGGWVGMALLSTALSLMMVYEFSEISFSLPDHVEKRYVMLLIAWSVALLNRMGPQTEFQLVVACFLALFAYFLLTAKRHQEITFASHFRELMASFFGIVYLVFLPLYFQKIYEFSFGVKWTLLFLLVVWSSDIGAYFAGMQFGRRKLYPLISPNKTCEGAVGGILAPIGVSLLFKILAFDNLSWTGAVILPIIVSIVAQIGDLCESFFKRAFGKKDSGSFLPGHGGILDRFDAVVFSLPAMYACMRIFS